MKQISLYDFEERLKNHDWQYQREQCASRWNDSRIEFSRLTEMSFQSPEHRQMFLMYKKNKEVK